MILTKPRFQYYFGQIFKKKKVFVDEATKVGNTAFCRYGLYVSEVGRSLSRSVREATAVQQQSLFSFVSDIPPKICISAAVTVILRVTTVLVSHNAGSS